MNNKQIKRLHSRKGFTIVELLIVIVVIAILAALAIASYSGIIAQANNAQTTTAVQAYRKALIQYATEKGEYPRATGPSGPWYNACLGEDYEGNACWSNGNVAEYSYFNNQLKPYIGGNLPMPATAPINGYVGAAFFYSTALTIDGNSHPWWLMYMLSGTGKKCPVGGPVPKLATWPAFTSEMVDYTGTNSTATSCYTTLPNPSNL